MISLCPSVEQSEDTWHNAKNGRVPETPIIQVQIPSVYDKTVAPEGRHVLSLWVYFLPAHVRDGSWPGDAPRVRGAAHRRGDEVRPELSGTRSSTGRC